MASRNDDQTKRSIEQIRRTPGASSPAGYSRDGQPRPVPGDEDAPFVKSPPFPESPVLWVQPTVLPTAAYFVSEGVDVEDYRLLKLYIEMLWPANTNSQLSVIPQMSGPNQMSSDDEAWYELGVVDPVPQYLQPQGMGNNFASRTFAQSEFRTPVLSAPFGAPRIVRLQLTFDVADATRFRAQLLQVVGGQALATFALSYARSN